MNYLWNQVVSLIAGLLTWVGAPTGGQASPPWNSARISGARDAGPTGEAPLILRHARELRSGHSSPSGHTSHASHASHASHTSGSTPSHYSSSSAPAPPKNHAPSAKSVTCKGKRNTQLPIPLRADDSDGDALTYSITDPPQHGALSGDPPDNLVYTPARDFHGDDHFTFVASDGTAPSRTATVKIRVDPVNAVPVATDLFLVTLSDRSVAVGLKAEDTENDRCTFEITKRPVHGQLTGEPPNPLYAPSPGYTGDDELSYVANDGASRSRPATVTIRVREANAVPVARADTVRTMRETAVSVTLAGSDADGDPLRFIVVEPPAHGTLSGDIGAATLTYTPEADYVGHDSLRFTASDGFATSEPAVVDLEVAE